MPWGHRSVSKSYRTAGETANLRIACDLYDLTEEQVMAANIPCQWRSCHGNRYAVVKLSDMASLKRQLAVQAKEDQKKALIEKLGEEGYQKKMAEEKAKKEADAAVAEAKRERERVARGLVTSLEAAMRASGNGIADTLDGMAIGKTAAKTEWYVKPEEIKGLALVDPSKKLAKYHLADVIRIADSKSLHNSGNGGHISTRVKSFPSRQKLYARYLHDNFEAQRIKVAGAGDDAIVQAAYDEVRGKIANAVEDKAAAAKKAQAELRVEEDRLAAFDGLLDNDMKKSSNGGKKRSAPKVAAVVEASPSMKENIENDSKKPAAAKKQKVKKTAKISDEQVSSSAVATKSGRGLASRRRNPVSYAEQED